MYSNGKWEVFDAHFHIIDDRYPLQPNKGYLPEFYRYQDYRIDTGSINLVGGAIVSGSFQGFDQTYLVQSLKEAGPGFVGVTQLPHTATDEEILEFHAAGIRAVRFNLKRGGSEGIAHLASMADRIYDLAGWHVELYVDSRVLPELQSTLTRLPAVSIDHLGLSNEGLPELMQLAERGVKVKATGFGRVDFEVIPVLKKLNRANPNALMFGTDLPSTRAPRPFQMLDLELVIEALGEDAAGRVFSGNAIEFYKLGQG